MGLACWRQRMAVLQVLVLVATLLLRVEAGLLGAGYGHGSCPAAPFRSDDLDHVGGCPRYAQCCTEYGYCHPKESWEKGYFRDCNGKSNGEPLPGSVIKLEAEQAALGLSQVTAEMLGISQDIWLQQINRAESTLAISSSSSGQISSSSQVSSGQISSGQISSGQISSGQISSTSSSLSSALIQQILLAIQPQVAAAVQSAVGSQSSSQSSAFLSNDISQSDDQTFSSFSTGLSSQSGVFQSSSQASQASLGLTSTSNRFEEIGQNNVGFTSSTSSTSGLGSEDLDVLQILSLVIAQLTPQIAEAVQ